MARHPSSCRHAHRSSADGRCAKTSTWHGRQLGKLALPVSDAQYYALLSRAYHGGVTRREMQWEISLVEAWGMILASGLLHGEAYIWPDPSLSVVGQKLIAARDLKQKWQSGDWQPQIEI